MTHTVARSQTSPFAVFRNRSFGLLWVGQVVETNNLLVQGVLQVSLRVYG